MTKTITNQRLALSLARVQVFELPPAVTTRAHMIVGYGAVAFGGANAPMTQLVRPEVQVQGTSGSNARVEKARVEKTQASVIGTDPVGGVRGIPPRGWPV